MQEWNALDATIEPMLQGMGALMFTDLAMHEHDLRGALGEPDHDALEVDAVMACALPSFAQPLQDAGLGAIVVEHDGHTWRSHDADAGWTLHVDAVGGDVRALDSRRTADELRALSAEGGGEAVLRGHRRTPAAAGAVARRVSTAGRRGRSVSIGDSLGGCDVQVGRPTTDPPEHRSARSR